MPFLQSLFFVCETIWTPFFFEQNGNPLKNVKTAPVLTLLEQKVLIFFVLKRSVWNRLHGMPFKMVASQTKCGDGPQMIIYILGRKKWPFCAYLNLSHVFFVLKCLFPTTWGKKQNSVLTSSVVYHKYILEWEWSLETFKPHVSFKK